MVGGLGCPLQFGMLVLRFCRMWRSYLSIWTQVCRVWRSYSSFSYSAALLFLLLLPLQHSNPTIVTVQLQHVTQCTWGEIRRLVTGNIPRVPHSLNSWHCTLLFTLRLVARSIHSVSLLILSDIVLTDFGKSFASFLAIHTMSFSLISLQRIWCCITFPFHLFYIPWYSYNETDKVRNIHTFSPFPPGLCATFRHLRAGR